MESEGLSYCPICNRRTAVWQNDFDADDAGYLVPGIVTFFLCNECSAEIEVFRPDIDPNEKAAK